MELDGSVFLCEIPILCLSGCGDTTWHHHNPDEHKEGIFMEKYGVVQVCFGEVVLLCWSILLGEINNSKFLLSSATHWLNILLDAHQ